MNDCAPGKTFATRKVRTTPHDEPHSHGHRPSYRRHCGGADGCDVWSGRFETILIQLIPDVNRPVITVDTNWRGASPAEVEREIVNRQEEVLRGIEGLTKMTSKSEDGSGTITLEFSIATNMDKALLLASNRLDRVSGYPQESDEPTLKTAGSEDQAIAWFIIKRTPDNNRPMHTFGELAKDVFWGDRIERVPGVGSVNVFGGPTARFAEIDPRKLAQFGLTVTDVVRAMRAANASVTAGDITEGKRRTLFALREIWTPSRRSTRWYCGHNTAPRAWRA